MSCTTPAIAACVSARLGKARHCLRRTWRADSAEPCNRPTCVRAHSAPHTPPCACDRCARPPAPPSGAQCPTAPAARVRRVRARRCEAGTWARAPAPWTLPTAPAVGRSSPARARWRRSPWRLVKAVRAVRALSVRGAEARGEAARRAWNSKSSSSRRKRACSALLSSRSPWSAAAHSAKNLRVRRLSAREQSCACASGAHRLLSFFSGGSALTRATVVCVSSRFLMTSSSSADTGTAIGAALRAGVGGDREAHRSTSDRREVGQMRLGVRQQRQVATRARCWDWGAQLTTAAAARARARATQA